MFFESLQTPRLILKNVEPADRRFLFQEFSDPLVTRYLLDQEPLAREDEADAILSLFLQPEPRCQHRYILVRREDGQKIGTCGFHCWRQDAGTVEIGYDLRPDAWGCGYAREALGGMLRFAASHMGLTAVKAHIYPENVRSVRLIERLGFSDSGHTVCYRFRGEVYQHRVYCLPLARRSGQGGASAR